MCSKNHFGYRPRAPKTAIQLLHQQPSPIRVHCGLTLWFTVDPLANLEATTGATHNSRTVLGKRTQSGAGPWLIFLITFPHKSSPVHPIPSQLQRLPSEHWPTGLPHTMTIFVRSKNCTTCNRKHPLTEFTGGNLDVTIALSDVFRFQGEPRATDAEAGSASITRPLQAAHS